MKKSVFNNLLYKKNILWNDKVNITIINPFHKRKWYNFFSRWFRAPEIVTLTGFLDYVINDKYVTITLISGCKTGSLFLDFNEIISIEKVID